MKGRQILLDHLGEVEAAALMVDGRLSDIYIDNGSPRIGTIFRATADRPMKGQGGMFLSAPDGKVFLRQVKGLSPGKALTVMSTSFAEPGKAPPVTTKVLFKSRYVIVTPGAPGINISRSIRDDDLRDELRVIANEVGGLDEGFGVILRSSCAEAEADVIAEDMAEIAQLAKQVMSDEGTAPDILVEGDGPHALAWREWTEPAEVVTEVGCFETHGVLDQLAELAGARVSLGPASAFVEPTRALVAIDVNTGTDTSPAAALKANLALARELPRQLRLRGLGGQIVIDPAPMPKKDRRQFETVLRKAFREDPVETILIGWTALGNFELQRQRQRSPLPEGLG